MKKKTIGRFAAAGLAAVSAVSVMSIAASADCSLKTVAVSGKSVTYITGTAAYVNWAAMYTLYTYDLTACVKANADGTYTYTEPVYNVAPTVGYATSSVPTLSTNAKSLGGTVTLNNAWGLGYYMTSSAAKDAYKGIDNDIQTKNKASKDTFDLIKKKMKSYCDYYTLTARASKVAANTAFKQNYTNWEGLSVTVEKPKDDTSVYVYYTSNKAEYSASKENSFADSAYTVVEFSYQPGMSPSQTYKATVNMSEIAQYFAPQNTVSVLSNNQLTEGAAFAIDLTGAYTSNSNNNNNNTNDQSTTTGSYIIPSAYRTASDLSYQGANNYWYPNQSALLVATGSAVAADTKVPTPAYSSTYCYFDPVTGNYTSSATGYAYAVSGTRTENAIYRVTGSGLYYYTWSSAYSAAGNDVSKVVYQRAITSSGPYFSRYTGNFYNSYTEALAASLNNSSYVISTGSSSTTSDDYDAYLAWLLSQYGNSSSSSNNNGSVTIGNRTGWNAVRSYINSARSGAVYNVSMNNETTIPQAVLAALNGKNVTVNFTLANGAVVSYNGRDIVNAQDVDVALTYNTNRVPNALLNAALTQVKNAVSTSSFSMTNNSFAADTTTAIRLNQKRAGCTAKLYRYNTARNSLQLVDSSVIGETGSVSFDNVTQGGDYVVVICNN